MQFMDIWNQNINIDAFDVVQVLFPLLDSVKRLSGKASDEKVDTSGSMLIHHSRNTAQKQWAETQVSTFKTGQQFSRPIIKTHPNLLCRY